MLLVGCLGCTAPPPPAPEVAALPQLSAHDHNELLTDVQHLIGEASAMHAAERYADAEHAWQNAWSLFSRNHLPLIRAADPAAAVALEYNFGRLRAALRERRGKPKVVSNALDVSLEAHRRPADAPVAPPP